MDKDFISIAKENQNLIKKVCNMFCKNEDDKKDLFQEILIQLWKSYETFRNEAKVSTWMYRVALNTAITMYRKEKRRPEHREFEDSYGANLNINYSYEKVENSIMLYKAIDQLTGIEKSIILLYMEDFSSDEISTILGITANNVRVKINRIKLKLKEILEKRYE